MYVILCEALTFMGFKEIFLAKKHFLINYKNCDVYSIDHTVSKKRLQSLDQGMTELYCCNGASGKLKGEELWRVEP